jgi:anti-sigma B factor antagonist
MITLTVSVPVGGAAASAEESLTLAITGELDVATAPHLATLLDGYVRGGLRRLVMDVSGVTFIDATGLHALNALRIQAALQHTTVVLAGVPPRMRRTMEAIEPARRFRSFTTSG